MWCSLPPCTDIVGPGASAWRTPDGPTLLPHSSLAATRGSKEASLLEGESGLTPARKNYPTFFAMSLIGHTWYLVACLAEATRDNKGIIYILPGLRRTTNVEWCCCAATAAVFVDKIGISTYDTQHVPCLSNVSSPEVCGLLPATLIAPAIGCLALAML